MAALRNHRVLAREHLAEATLLADAGRTDEARSHLSSAADHALAELAEQRERVATGLSLTRDADTSLDDADLDACFDLVQTLVDATLAEPTTTPPPRDVPRCGGASGAMRWRGAETAGRALTRLAAAFRR
jgi:hypothetical protein